jgi:flagellar biosynthesis chaperone FliJ
MKVSVLQQFLRSLAAPLQSAGAAKQANDLEQTCQALEPFAEQDFAHLAASLVQAQEFHQTKLLPLLKSKSRTGGRGVERTLNDAQLQHLAQQVKHLEQRATSGSETQRGELAAELDRLGLENLNKTEAINLAKEVGLQTRVRTTAQDVHQQLRRLILEGREALKQPAQSSAKPVDTAKVQHLAQQVRQLEEKAASTDASLDGLNTELDHIGLDSLTKEEALAVAKELGVHAASRTPATELVVQIRRSVLDRKEALETARV